jgi:hypothetical protein
LGLTESSREFPQQGTADSVAKEVGEHLRFKIIQAGGGKNFARGVVGLILRKPTRRPLDGLLRRVRDRDDRGRAGKALRDKMGAKRNFEELAHGRQIVGEQKANSQWAAAGSSMPDVEAR